jgi:hypothetical protein
MFACFGFWHKPTGEDCPKRFLLSFPAAVGLTELSRDEFFRLTELSRYWLALLTELSRPKPSGDKLARLEPSGEKLIRREPVRR